MAIEYQLPFTALEVEGKLNKIDETKDYYDSNVIDNRFENKQDKLDSYVSKVNGKSGDVNLTSDDVGALSKDTVIPVVPTNVSAFTNDAGYLTEHQSLGRICFKDRNSNRSYKCICIY